MTAYAIERTRIIGTAAYTYSGWEPDDEQHPHSAITHIAGQRYGAISSRRLPEDLAALPAGPDRIEQVRAFYDQLCLREYQLICAVFPEVIGTCPSPTGTIELQRDPALPALQNEVRYHTEPVACPGIITSQRSAYEVACWIDAILAEGEHIALNTVMITRCCDEGLKVARQMGHWTPAELADLILWPRRREVNDALRTHYLRGATR